MTEKLRPSKAPFVLDDTGLGASWARRRFRKEFGFTMTRKPPNVESVLIGKKEYFASACGHYWLPSNGLGRLRIRGEQTGAEPGQTLFSETDQ